MTKKGAKPPTDGAGSRSAVDLARDLADRERQLRDLTEQALGFLEELAESRRLNADRDQLAGRISELERALTDARQRLLHAGGCVVAPPERGAKKVPLAVAFWGSETYADAVACSALCSDVPVLWVGLPASVPQKGKAGALQTVVHRDAHTEAQCWNLAMAATAAECVLLLGPGARLLRQPSLRGALPPNAALLCPRIERNKSFEIGCEEGDDLLRLRPRLVTADGDGITAVPWPAAQAFVVRRAVLERVGLFDESLVGPAALLDYTLRARRQNFDVFALPGLEVAAGEQATTPESPTDQSMRLLLLAAHRPSKLGKALAETQLLWTLGTEAPGFLALLLAHLPVGEGLADQRSVFDQICVGLIATATPSIEVTRRVTTLRAALLREFADADLPAGKDELAARLRDNEVTCEGPPEAAFEALARDIALCARLGAAAAATVHQIRAELQAIDVERHAHMARAEQSEGARSTAQTQLDQVQRWLVDAQQELRQLHEARHEVAQHLDDARTELARSQQQQEHTRAELANAQQQLEQARAELAGSRQRLEHALAELAGSQQLLEQVRAELAGSQQQLEQARTELAGSRQQYELAHAELARLQQQQQVVSQAHEETERKLREVHRLFGEVARGVGLSDGAVPGALHERLTQLHQDSQRLTATLQAAGAVDAAALLANIDSLGQRLDAAIATISERERWIASLLDEVAKRRLFRRDLLDHERALLERVRRMP
jgi:predicted  nucleic acid-binding Zn-ribbon protein